MPYANEHAARINDPDKYDKIRRENDKFGTGIHAIWGILKSGKTELQAIRFDSSKFTPTEAKKWLKDHDYDPIEFEEASGKNENQEIEYKTFRFNLEAIESKAMSNDIGMIKGYASTFGNVDLGDDIVQRGAFLKTIEKYQKAGDKIPICFQHSLMDIVGGCDPSKMREDENGLYIEGEIYKKTCKGADVYELAKQKVLNKMSIGYSIDDCEYGTEEGKNVRILKDLNLYEISMVAHPMNEMARITDVKADKSDESVSIGEIIQILSDRNISLIDKKNTLSKILRKNILSKKAAEFIMSFIFNDDKKQSLSNIINSSIDSRLDEVKNIFDDILKKSKNDHFNDKLLLAKNEFIKAIK